MRHFLLLSHGSRCIQTKLMSMHIRRSQPACLPSTFFLLLLLLLAFLVFIIIYYHLSLFKIYYFLILLYIHYHRSILCSEGHQRRRRTLDSNPGRWGQNRAGRPLGQSGIIISFTMWHHRFCAVRDVLPPSLPIALPLRYLTLLWRAWMTECGKAE